MTPDHWHVKIAIEALKAGKDVFCEKPLTLTVDEESDHRRCTIRQSGPSRWGRSSECEYRLRFLAAVTLVRDGLIGEVKRAVCDIGNGADGGSFPKRRAPGRTWTGISGSARSRVDYIAERCHHDFRFWYEYSGGKFTDGGPPRRYRPVGNRHGTLRTGTSGTSHPATSRAV